jgi:hypothetical protein
METMTDELIKAELVQARMNAQYLNGEYLKAYAQGEEPSDELHTQKIAAENFVASLEHTLRLRGTQIETHIRPMEAAHS